jgi:hypothetical protein
LLYSAEFLLPLPLFLVLPPLPLSLLFLLSELLEGELIREVLLVMRLRIYHQGRVILHVTHQDAHEFVDNKLHLVQEVVIGITRVLLIFIFNRSHWRALFGRWSLLFLGSQVEQPVDGFGALDDFLVIRVNRVRLLSHRGAIETYGLRDRDA